MIVLQILTITVEVDGFHEELHNVVICKEFEQRLPSSYGLKLEDVTRWLNGPESPIKDLLKPSGKRWIEEFNEDDLNELNNSTIEKYECDFVGKSISVKGSGTYVCYICGSKTPFNDVATAELIDYLAERFVFTKPEQKKVLMTVEAKDGLGCTKQTLRTWTIK